ncbi:beta-ketoacyl synthase chain length factor [Pseudoalteromonas pernae]|uniref:beta-ketoacyl synthase chain length factor n=1 Tax=Pseudoalteromonas pernae TaxID=3118054 RepID=UPI0032424260
MKCAVEKLALYVSPTCSDNNELNDLIQRVVDALVAIDVSWVKPMQRRRLSQFAKMILSCAHSVNPNEEPIPIVFSSRHGDLHKTSDLLEQLVENEPLSPTQFGLSVHNAVVGLLSILTNNKAPITAIAGGMDSLSSALCEAYIQLHSGVTDKVMIIHADRELPNLYKEFADELQCDHCIAFILEKPLNSDGFELQQTARQEPQSSLVSSLKLAYALTHKSDLVIDTWRISHG